MASMEFVLSNVPILYCRYSPSSLCKDTAGRSPAIMYDLSDSLEHLNQLTRQNGTLKLNGSSFGRHSNNLIGRAKHPGRTQKLNTRRSQNAANRMFSTTVVNGMPDCIRNLLLCSLVDLINRSGIYCTSSVVFQIPDAVWVFICLRSYKLRRAVGRTEGYGEPSNLNLDKWCNAVVTFYKCMR